MTSICALQLVERGKLTLDEPVYQHIPELKDFPVITSIKEDGTPIEEPHKVRKSGGLHIKELCKQGLSSS